MVPASAFTVEGADAPIGLRFFLPSGTAQDRQRYGYFSGRAALGVLRMNFQKLDLFPTTLSKYCSAAGRRSGAKLAICSAIFLAGAFFLADEFAGARGGFNMGPPTGIGTVFDAPPPVFAPEVRPSEVRPIERIERRAPA